MLGIDEYNEEVTQWDADNKEDLIHEMDVLDIRHSKNSPNKIALRNALKSRLKRSFDMINKISYTFPRSAVFLAKGVGRGHPISNPRQAKDWYNSVVEKNLDKLGDIAANGQGNLIINNIDIH